MTKKLAIALLAGVALAGTVLAGREGYSFNEETGAIGIDFNWREQDISQIISEVESWIPFIKVNVFEEHRFKCNVNVNIVGFDEIKNALEDKYEDIDETVLKKAAEKGSMIHAEIENYIKNNELGFSSELYNFIQIKENNNLENIQSEVKVHDENIAGTIDIIADNIEEKCLKKVTRIWGKKSGKATKIDRILILKKEI